MMEANMIVIRESNTFYFYFGWSKNIDENLNHEIEFITKSNEFLSDNTKKWYWTVIVQI